MPTQRKRQTRAQVKSFLAPYDTAVQNIALKTRAMVLDVVPEALEQIDVPAKMLAYGFKATYQDLICVIMPQKAWVNLGFPRGAELSDPTKFLTGTGKRARHVKITDEKQLDAPELRNLVRMSVAQLKRA